MKMRLSILLLTTMSLFLASCSKYPGVPTEYHSLLDSALVKAGENRVEMEKALDLTPRSQREGMAFLISYMPENDLTSLSAAFLLKNTELAYRAKERFPWGDSIPKDLFLNYVLPYFNAGETRDEWREEFYNRFAPYVESCQTLEEAVYAINENAHAELKVEYSTARRRADQSPGESLEIMIASCTGLSILLTDAFRAVGIPSRLAGTIWVDDRGNHTWTEVWMGDKWYFTEYYYPGELDNAWFLADAGKSVPGDEKYAVVAGSYAPTGELYTLPWHWRGGKVYGYDVSQRYVDIYQKVYADKMADGNHTLLRVKMFKDKRHTTRSEDRIKVNIDIFQGKEQIGGGSTAGPTQDMNDVLTFLVEKNKSYTLKYFPDGQSLEKEIYVGDNETEVVLSNNR